MSLNKRIVTILLAGLFLLLLLPNWSSALRDLDPDLTTFAFLLLVGLLNVLVPFSAPELSLFTLVMVPVLYTAFHFLSGLPVADTLVLIVRCCLALVFYFIISSLLKYLKDGAGKTILLLTGAPVITAVWTFLLVPQTILLSLSLPLIAGLLLYYLKESGKRWPSRR